MGVVTHGQGLPRWSDYPRFLRRHRAWIAAFVDLGLLTGLVWSVLQPPVFSATASVSLSPVPVYVMTSTDELVPPEVSIDTDAQLLQSPQVLAAVGDALGVTEDQARGHFSVTASPQTHVLHVTVTSASARRAADAADAAVAALTDVRRQTLGALRLDQLRQLRLRVSTQEQLLAREQAKRVVIPANDELFASLLELRAGLQELEETRRQPAEVVRPALEPTDPDHANAEVGVTSGAMLGLLAGCLAGAARDRVRRRRHESTTAQNPAISSGPTPDAAHRTEDYDYAY